MSELIASPVAGMCATAKHTWSVALSCEHVLWDAAGNYDSSADKVIAVMGMQARCTL